MRRICVVTGTRSEYGLLYNVMKRIDQDEDLELQLIVTGNHLSSKYGYTIKNIYQDGFNVLDTIDILFESNDRRSVAKSTGLAVMEIANSFQRLKPDMLLILGDRYEIFAAASAAMMMNIPIAHISGGEVTHGAIDEQIRHSITKMAHLHFPGTELYAKNIIRMGEDSWRVINAGDPGIENIRQTKFLSRDELYKELGVRIDDRTLLCTFHPVTLESNNLFYYINEYIKALDEIGHICILTYPNADCGSDYIIQRIEEFQNKNRNIFVFKNLGTKKYLSVMKECGCVVGNSSSAIVEAPYLKIPVVDIGNRQKGRLKAKNIIECQCKKDEIINSIRKALTPGFREIVKKAKSLYGDGNTSEIIVSTIREIKLNNALLKKKLTW